MTKLTNRQIDVALREDPDDQDDFDLLDYVESHWDDFEEYQKVIEPEPDWFYDPWYDDEPMVDPYPMEYEYA